jgi:amino acid adenylation domain-containing protein
MRSYASESRHVLHGRFLRGVELFPDRNAIRIRGRDITYADTHSLALTWAGSILRACEQPPTVIGVLADKGLESYVGILTALYCGASAVPLQPDFPVSRTRSMLKAAKVSALVTDERGYRQLPELTEAGGLPVLLPGAERTAPTVPVRESSALARPQLASASDTAYILFTSGSTGRPKGVRITHGNLGHYFRELDARYGFGPDDAFSQVFAPAFDCAIFDLFAAWGAGGTVVSVPDHAYRAMTEFVTAERITVWYSTPAAISVVARHGGLPAKSMPTLRLSTFAGDALRAADAAAWQEAAPEAVIDNLYGPAETTITCSAYRWSRESSPGECLHGIVPIGRLHSGHHYMLLDEHGDEDPAEGELCVRGPQVSPGYLDPADDGERFITRGSRRWYRTGDRIRLAGSGDLLFVGRVDNQVQVQGWRTELAEIDHHVRRCSGITDAVTVAAVIDGSQRLVVFYTGRRTTITEFARQLMAELPQQLVPRHYQHLAEMPLSVNRKIDRQALRQRASGLFPTSEAPR